MCKCLIFVCIGQQCRKIQSGVQILPVPPTPHRIGEIAFNPVALIGHSPNSTS